MFHSCLAQDHLDAFVRIIDDKDLAGAVGIYRFTIELQESLATIQTFLPESVDFQGVDGGNPVVCRHYLISHTEDFQNCVFEEAQNMIQFDIPDDAALGFFIYELGELKNPLYSQNLSGFLIRLLDSNGDIMYQSNEDLVFVKVNPNLVTDQSLDVQSKKVADITTYSFSFKVTNPVPSGGQIELQFPTDTHEVPDELTSQTLSVYGDAPISVSYTTSTVGLKITVPTEIPVNSDPSALIVLELVGVKNPNTIEETGSFILRTRTATNKVIDEVEEGLTVICNEPAEIVIDQITIYNKMVGQTTMATFKLSLPTVYSAGGYLTVTLPDTVSVNDIVMDCLLHIGFESDQGMCNIPEDGVVRLYDTIKQASLTFTIQGIVNPPNTMPTNTFEFRAYDSAGNMIASSLDQPDVNYTPTPGTIKYPVVGRQNYKVGAAASDSNIISFTFTQKNTIQDGELIELTVPHTEFLLVQDVDLHCEAQGPLESDPVLTSCDLDVLADTFVITYPARCSPTLGCLKNSQQSLYISAGLQNLNWIIDDQTLASVEMRTYTADKAYLIDSKTSGINATPALEEGDLSSLLLEKELGVVGEDTEFSFELTPSNKIPMSGKVVVEFQKDTMQVPEVSTSIVCLRDTLEFDCITETQDDGYYLKYLQIEDPCGVGMYCEVGEAIAFTIQGLLNPRSTKPIINLFVMRSYTQDMYAIDKGTVTDATGLDIEPAAIMSSSLVEPAPTDAIVTGAVQTYTVQVMTTNGIAATYGRLEIVMPDEIFPSDNQSSSACVAFEDATMVVLDCEQVSNTVRVSHTHADKNFKGSDITVKVTNGYKNPPSTKESSFFQVASYLLDIDSGIYWKVDEDTAAFTVTANTPNTLHSSTVTRDQDQVSLDVSLEVCFSPTNIVPENSVLVFTIPADQVVLTGDQTLSNPQVGNIAYLTKVGTSISLILPTSLAAQEEFCLTVNDNMVNPDTTMPPTSSFALALTTSAGYQIDLKDSNIFAQPYLSAGPFASLAVSQLANLNMVNQVTSLSVELTFGSDTAMNSMIRVTLPPSLYYESGSGLTCSTDVQPTSACESSTHQADLFGDYYEHIDFKLAQSYQAGDQLVLTIDNLLNKFSTSVPTDLEVLVQSLDPQTYTINSSTVTMVVPTLAANPTAIVSAATRSNLVVQKETTVSISLVTSTRLQNGSYLRISLSEEQLVPSGSIACKVDNQATFCQANGNIIELSLVCSNVCPDQSTFEIEITGFKNRVSTYRNMVHDEVTFETYDVTNSHLVDFSETGLLFEDELSPLQATISEEGFSLSWPVVGELTAASFKIDYEGVVPAGSKATLNFDQVNDIDLSGPILLYQGGYVPVTEVTDQLVANTSTDSLTIVVNSVLNLLRVQPLSTEVTFFIEDAQQGRIAEGTSEIRQVDLLQQKILESVTVTRLSQELGQSTDVLVEIELNQMKIPQFSSITILVPQSVLGLNQSGSGVYQLDESHQASFQATSDGNFYRVEIADSVCGTYACPIDHVIQIQLSDAFKNPADSQLIEDSIQIMITHENYQVASIDENVQLQPALYAPEFNDLLISQSGLMTGSEAYFTIDYSLSRSLPTSSKMIFQIPDETVLFTTADATVCTASVDDTEESLACEVISRSAQSGEPRYVHSVQIWEFSSPYLQEGTLTQITIDGLKNVEFCRSRKEEHSFELTFASSTNHVLAHGTFSDSELDNFQPNKITDLTVVRGSNAIGRNNVEYTFDLVTPNFVRSGSIFHIGIPKEQAEVEGGVTCRDVLQGKFLNCRQNRQDDHYTYIEVEKWCKSTCSEGQQLQLAVELQNSNSLQANYPEHSFSAEIITMWHEQIAIANQEVFVSPNLEGLKIDHVSVERKESILGAIDTLKIFIPSMKSTISFDTDLWVKFPRGFAYEFDIETICHRIFNEANTDSQILKRLDCEVIILKDNYLPTSHGSMAYEVESIRIKNVCSSLHFCENKQALKLQLEMVNPSTNQQNYAAADKFTITLRTGDGFDLGMGEVNDLDELAQLQPNTIAAVIYEEDDCFATATICDFNIKLDMPNPATHVTVTLPDGLLPQNDSQVMFKKAGQFGFLPDSWDLTYNKVIYGTITDSQKIKLEIPIDWFYDQFTIQVKISKVLQPKSTFPIGDILIRSFEENQNGYGVIALDNNDLAPINYSVPRASAFKQLSISRVGSTDFNQIVELEVDIQTTSVYAQQIQEELIFSLKIQPSAGEISQLKCMHDQIELECRMAQGYIVIPNFLTQLPEAPLGVKVVLSDFINANFATMHPNNFQDSALAYLSFFATLGEEEKEFFVHETTQDTFVQPSLIPSELELLDFKLTPDPKASEEVEVNIKVANMKRLVDQTNNPYFYIGFSMGSSNQFQSMYRPLPNPMQQTSPEIQITFGSEISEIVTNIGTGSTYGSYDHIIFPLLVSDQDDFDSPSTFTIRHVVNPNWVDEFNRLAEVEVHLLADSSDNLNSKATAKGTFETRLQPGDIYSADLYLNEPFPSSDTNVEFSFKMKPQLDMPREGFVEITIPETFSVQRKKFKVMDLMFGRDVNFTWKDKNTFSFDLSHKKYYQTPYDTTLGVKFGPVTNPDQVSDDQQLQVKVYTNILGKMRTYAQGSSPPLLVKEQGDPETCPIDCEKCDIDGICYECQVPAVNPFLVGGACQQACPAGTFVSESRCAPCAEGCESCSSLKSCSVCQTTAESTQYLLDGACVDECPLARDITAVDGKCVRQNDEGLACSVNKCDMCGYDEDYCAVCNPGYASLHGLQCVKESNCPEGSYYDEKAGSCEYCSKVCGTCEGGANRCTSCLPPDNPLYSLNTIYVKSSMTCVAECPAGTYLARQSETHCYPCQSNCNTCERDGHHCTSCFMSAYNDHDAFLNKETGECSESCPFFSQANLETHECDILDQLLPYNLWPTFFLVASLICIGVLMVTSRVMTLKNDAPVDILCALLHMPETLNKVMLVGFLMNTTKYGLFTMTLGSILGSSLVSIAFLEAVQKPMVHIIKDNGRPDLYGSYSKKTVTFINILAIMFGLDVLRLLNSNAFNSKHLNVKFQEKSPLFYKRRLDHSMGYCSALQFLQTIVGVICIFKFGFDEAPFTLGINCFVFGVSILSVQQTIRNRDQKELQQYESVGTSDNNQNARPVVYPVSQ